VILGDFLKIIRVLGFANRLKANAKSYLNSPDYFSALALATLAHERVDGIEHPLETHGFDKHHVCFFAQIFSPDDIGGDEDHFGVG
jgi:hypothetical protein